MVVGDRCEVISGSEPITLPQRYVTCVVDEVPLAMFGCDYGPFLVFCDVDTEPAAES